MLTYLEGCNNDSSDLFLLRSSKNISQHWYDIVPKMEKDKHILLCTIQDTFCFKYSERFLLSSCQ